MITKILQGVVNITESGDYNLVLPNSIGRVQNSLAILNIDEVFITVQENINANIYLPPISSFSNAWNCKIYLVSKGSTVLYPTNLIDGNTNYINYFSQQEVNQGATAYIHISNNENYALWLSQGGFAPIIERSIITQLTYLTKTQFKVGDIVSLQDAKLELTLAEILPAKPQDFYNFTTFGNIGLVQIGSFLQNIETGTVAEVTYVEKG